MPKKKEYPLGTVFNPHSVGVNYRVRFQYDKDCAFEVMLDVEGKLDVRATGHHSDLLSTHQHVANNLMIVARRWSPEENRYAEFIKALEVGE